MQTESEFLALAEAQFAHLEQWVETVTDGECETFRNGHVLAIELDDGRQVIVNIQAPMQEIWFASPFGGHHFRLSGQAWCDTRTEATLESVIAEALTRMGVEVTL